MCVVVLFQAVTEIIAKQQEEAATVDRDLSAYRVYRQAQRAALWTTWVTTATAEMAHHRTWFQGELFILQSWMHLSETERVPYRHLQSEEEARAQIRQDADGILRALRMGKFQHRIYAGVRDGANPLSAIGTEFTKAMMAIHHPELSASPPSVREVSEPEFVYPPSYFTFARVQRQTTTSTSTWTSFPMTSSSFATTSSTALPYRPPPGFIAFVVDNQRDLSRHEYLLDDDGLEEMTRRWLSLVKQTDHVARRDALQQLVAREVELEAIGNVQMADRQRQREEYQAKCRPTGFVTGPAVVAPPWPPATTTETSTDARPPPSR